MSRERVSSQKQEESGRPSIENRTQKGALDYEEETLMQEISDL